MTTDVARQVVAYRAEATEIRRLFTRGGNNAATTKARLRHEAAQNEACYALVAAGHGELAGLLTLEDTLRRNIAQRKANNATYPELTQRLRTIRARIRATVDAR